MKRKHAVLAGLTALAALLVGVYLWCEAEMRPAPLPRVVRAREKAVRPPDRGCTDPILRNAVPCQFFDSLVVAAQEGQAARVKRLLGGADRKLLNKALFAAAEGEPLVLWGPDDHKAADEVDRGYGQVAEILIQKGAQIGVRDEAGRTPLIAAAGHGETSVVRVLLAKGAAVEATDATGTTPLLAAACNCPIIDMPDTYESIRLLLAHGANIEARNKWGHTPLMEAAAWGRVENAQLLLNRGANIEGKDTHGNTALLSAARGNGYPTADAVKLLLERGANIEATNDNGDTSLILAAAGRGAEDVAIVKLLIGHGANLQARNKQGHTALELARRNGHTEKAAILSAAATTK